MDFLYLATDPAPGSLFFHVQFFESLVLEILKLVFVSSIYRTEGY